MPALDNRIYRLAEQIGEHYRNNVNNQYVRRALLHLKIDSGTWDLIAGITDLNDHYKLRDYRLDEIYERITALALFVNRCRQDAQPNLKHLLQDGQRSVLSRGGASPGTERVLLDMAIKNFPSNIDLLADMIREFFEAVKQHDRDTQRSGRPVYEKMPGLANVDRYLRNGSE